MLADRKAWETLRKVTLLEGLTFALTFFNAPQRFQERMAEKGVCTKRIRHLY